MQFENTILANGQTFVLQYTRRNARGYEEAHYYNANSWQSNWITITGDFVSVSI